MNRIRLTHRFRPVFVLVALLIPSLNASGQPAFENFGHWKVAAVHDPMDAVSHVIMQTTLAGTERGALEGQNAEAFFGFRILGGAVATVHAPQSMGRNFWPYCDFDTATFSVDLAPPQPLATIRRGGSCNAIPTDGELLAALRAGKVTRVRLNRANGYISPHGFNDAWRRAEDLQR